MDADHDFDEEHCAAGLLAAWLIVAAILLSSGLILWAIWALGKLVLGWLS